MFSTKAEANIRYIKSELEALSDSGSLQEISLDPIQIALGESGVQGAVSMGGLGTVSMGALGTLGDMSGLEQAGGLESSQVPPRHSNYSYIAHRYLHQSHQIVVWR